MTLPFPADSAEYEEYVSVMEAMADEAEASTPDPEPEDFDDYPNSQEEDEAYWASMEERDYGGEDSYLDSYWEDQSEYGMEGCCGDF